MRIAVFTDSHGDVEPMIAAIRTEKPDLVLHLGDHARDAEDLCREFPAMDIRFVRGNCDWGSDAPEVLTPKADGVTIFMTHGHRYNVKYTLDSLANAAHFAGAQLCLFGHTHESEYKVMGDVTLFNPGAAGRGGCTYGMITVERGNFQCKIKEL